MFRMKKRIVKIGILILCVMIMSSSATISIFARISEEDAKDNIAVSGEMSEGGTLNQQVRPAESLNGGSGTGTVQTPSTYTDMAGRNLTGNTKKVYDYVKDAVIQIAAGKITSTVIVPQSSTYQVDFRLIFYTLRLDCPYEMFWCTKYSVDTYSNPDIDIFKLVVSDEYKGADEYTVDVSKLQKGWKALENAKAVVEKHKDKDDREKLTAYKSEIKSLAEYDFSAAENNSSQSDRGPWSFVNVFDDDPNTNVTCAGFSKAFQLLFNLSTFRSNVSCITVEGRYAGRTSGHMWNIVNLEGQNYLVDLTSGNFLIMAEESLDNGTTFVFDAQVSTALEYDPITKLQYGEYPNMMPHKNITIKGKVRSYNENNPITVSVYKWVDELGENPANAGVFRAADGGGIIEQEFELTDTIPRMYHLVIRKEGHVDYKVNYLPCGLSDVNISIDESGIEKVINLVPGDLNGSGYVSVEDVQIATDKSNIYVPIGEAANKACDINGDGMINAQDANIVSRNIRRIEGLYNAGTADIESEIMAKKLVSDDILHVEFYAKTGIRELYGMQTAVVAVDLGKFDIISNLGEIVTNEVFATEGKTLYSDDNRFVDISGVYTRWACDTAFCRMGNTGIIILSPDYTYSKESFPEKSLLETVRLKLKENVEWDMVTPDSVRFATPEEAKAAGASAVVSFSDAASDYLYKSCDGSKDSLTVTPKLSWSGIEFTNNDTNLSLPSAKATYGQTLKEVELINPSDNPDGKFEWVNPDLKVGNVSPTGNVFKARFISNDGKIIEDLDIAIIVSEKNVVNPTIVISPSEYVWKGEPIIPSVVVKDGDTVIPENEYVLSYYANNKVGEAFVRVSPADKSNYSFSGEIGKHFNIISVTTNQKVLTKIEVVEVPKKISYVEGENFDPTGMSVTAFYSDNTTATGVAYKVEDGEALKAGKTAVTISYTENDKTVTTPQTINVSKKSGDDDTKPSQPGTGEGDAKPGQPGTGEGDAKPSQPGTGEGDAKPGQPGTGEGDAKASQPGTGEGDAKPGQPGTGEGDAKPGQPGTGEGDAKPGQPGTGEGDTKPGQPSAGNRVMPTIIRGNGQIWDIDVSKEFEIVSDAPFNDFVKVLINGNDLETKYYTVREGSTIVNIKAEYLNSLSVGEYEIVIVSSYGSAVGRFKVASLIGTQDKSLLAQWWLTASVAMLVALAIIYSRLKKV